MNVKTENGVHLRGVTDIETRGMSIVAKDPRTEKLWTVCRFRSAAEADAAYCAAMCEMIRKRNFNADIDFKRAALEERLDRILGTNKNRLEYA